MKHVKDTVYWENLEIEMSFLIIKLILLSSSLIIRYQFLVYE